MYRSSRRTLRFSILLFLVASGPLAAQPYVDVDDGGRYRFAQIYLGADVQATGGDASAPFTTPTGVATTSLSTSMTPRLTIGGLHFWGHADFYVTFPIAPSSDIADLPEVASAYSTGIETGARFYPWRMEIGRVVPFVGASWNVATYQQESEAGSGPLVTLHRMPLQAGLTWTTSVGNVEAGGAYMLDHAVDYPLSRTARGTVELPAWSTWLGFKYFMDVTLSAEAFDESGNLAKLERHLDSTGALNSFSVAIGPSTALTLGHSSYTTRSRPYLDDRLVAGIFPDLGIGYYHYGLDAAANISYRPIAQEVGGYGVEQEITRRSVALELFKFLGDYHGFVPFVGVTFGREWLRLTERDGDRVVHDVRDERWAPGFVFGWDIRPTRVDGFLLRTNLRYTPALSLEVTDGQEIAFDQLEIDFIQLVLYPGRLF